MEARQGDLKVRIAAPAPSSRRPSACWERANSRGHRHEENVAKLIQVAKACRSKSAPRSSPPPRATRRARTTRSTGPRGARRDPGDRDALADNLPRRRRRRASRAAQARKKVGGAQQQPQQNQPQQRPEPRGRCEQRQRAGRARAANRSHDAAGVASPSAARRRLGSVERRRGRTDHLPRRRSFDAVADRDRARRRS
jgi:hypothetical protein